MKRRKLEGTLWWVMAIALVWAAPAGAITVPPGYQAGVFPVGAGVVGLDLGSDGSLVIGTTAGDVIRMPSGGGAATTLASGFGSIAAVAVDPVTGTVAVGDSNPDLDFGTVDGKVFTLPSGGGPKTEVVGVDFIFDLTYTPGGSLFATNSAGGGSGTVLAIDTVLGTATAVATGFGFTAGLGFDASGNLFVLDPSASGFFSGDGFVALFTAAELAAPGVLDIGAGDGTVIASGLPGGYDLVIDAEGDIFITAGNEVLELANLGGGLFSADRFISGIPDGPFGPAFSTILGLSSTSDPFEPFGPSGTTLFAVADFANGEFLTVTPAPEPGTIALLLAGLGGMALLGGRRRR